MILLLSSRRYLQHKHIVIGLPALQDIEFVFILILFLVFLPADVSLPTLINKYEKKNTLAPVVMLPDQFSDLHKVELVIPRRDEQ